MPNPSSRATSCGDSPFRSLSTISCFLLGVHIALFSSDILLLLVGCPDYSTGRVSRSNWGQYSCDLFLEIDKPALRPLPKERYTITAWKKATVHIDYHVDVEKTHYSVPYTLIGQEVDVSYTSSMVEIYHRGKR